MINITLVTDASVRPAFVAGNGYGKEMLENEDASRSAKARGAGVFGVNGLRKRWLMGPGGHGASGVHVFDGSKAGSHRLVTVRLG